MLGVTAKLRYEQNVDVYVGMPCSAGEQRLQQSICFFLGLVVQIICTTTVSVLKTYNG